jgi:hypothetical protein
MVFQEIKKEIGYLYKVEDVFGTIEIESDLKLDGSTLDDIVVLLIGKNLKAQVITGEVKHSAGVVKYKFEKAPVWSDDDEKKETCTNILTSTKKQESVYIPIRSYLSAVLSWLQRFMGAFREAWKKSYPQEK